MAAVGELPRRGFGGHRLAPPRRLLAALSDERLAERLRHGDGVAFELLYDRHHRSLLGFCRNMLRSQEEAEDAVQHVFMSAYRALTEREHRPRQLKPWLYTIGRNHCLSMIRSRKEVAGSIDDRVGAPDPAPSEKAEERADLSALVSDLRNLPEVQRTALVLTELGGFSHSEVAQILACEQGKVRALVFQARDKLIEQRDAREASCPEIREEIANLTGSRLRGRARRHAKSCAACASFADQVRQQRRSLALALPIVPSLGLKRSLLAATTGGGGGMGGGLTAAGTGLKSSAVGGAAGLGGAASTGGAGAGGGASAGAGFLAALTTKVGVTKAAAVVVAGTSVAAGLATDDRDPEGSRSAAPPPSTGESRPGEARAPTTATDSTLDQGGGATGDRAVPPHTETNGKAWEPAEHGARLSESEAPPAHAAARSRPAAPGAGPSPVLARKTPEARGSSSRVSDRPPGSRPRSAQAESAPRSHRRADAARNHAGVPVANSRPDVATGEPERRGTAEIAKDDLAEKLNKARVRRRASER